MDFKQRIVFREDDNEKLVEFLINNNIGFLRGDPNIPIAVLEILESSKFWPEVKKYLDRNDLFAYTLDSRIM